MNAKLIEELKSKIKLETNEHKQDDYCKQSFDDKQFAPSKLLRKTPAPPNGTCNILTIVNTDTEQIIVANQMLGSQLKSGNDIKQMQLESKVPKRPAASSLCQDTRYKVISNTKICLSEKHTISSCTTTLVARSLIASCLILLSVSLIEGGSASASAGPRLIGWPFNKSALISVGSKFANISQQLLHASGSSSKLAQLAHLAQPLLQASRNQVSRNQMQTQPSKMTQTTVTRQPLKSMPVVMPINHPSTFHYFWNHDSIEPEMMAYEATKILAEAQRQQRRISSDLSYANKETLNVKRNANQQQQQQFDLQKQASETFASPAVARQTGAHAVQPTTGQQQQAAESVSLNQQQLTAATNLQLASSLQRLLGLVSHLQQQQQQLTAAASTGAPVLAPAFRYVYQPPPPQQQQMTVGHVQSVYTPIYQKQNQQQGQRQERVSASVGNLDASSSRQQPVLLDPLLIQPNIINYQSLPEQRQVPVYGPFVIADEENKVSKILSNKNNGKHGIKSSSLESAKKSSRTNNLSVAASQTVAHFLSPENSSSSSTSSPTKKSSTNSLTSSNLPLLNKQQEEYFERLLKNDKSVENLNSLANDIKSIIVTQFGSELESIAKQNNLLSQMTMANIVAASLPVKTKNKHEMAMRALNLSAKLLEKKQNEVKNNDLSQTGSKDLPLTGNVDDIVIRRLALPIKNKNVAYIPIPRQIKRVKRAIAPLSYGGWQTSSANDELEKFVPAISETREKPSLNNLATSSSWLPIGSASTEHPDWSISTKKTARTNLLPNIDNTESLLKRQADLRQANEKPPASPATRTTRSPTQSLEQANSKIAMRTYTANQAYSKTNMTSTMEATMTNGKHNALTEIQAPRAGKALKVKLLNAAGSVGQEKYKGAKIIAEPKQKVEQEMDPMNAELSTRVVNYFKNVDGERSASKSASKTGDDGHTSASKVKNVVGEPEMQADFVDAINERRIESSSNNNSRKSNSESNYFLRQQESEPKYKNQSQSTKINQYNQQNAIDNQKQNIANMNRKINEHQVLPNSQSIIGDSSSQSNRAIASMNSAHFQTGSDDSLAQHDANLQSANNIFMPESDTSGNINIPSAQKYNQSSQQVNFDSLRGKMLASLLIDAHSSKSQRSIAAIPQTQQQQTKHQGVEMLSQRGSVPSASIITSTDQQIFGEQNNYHPQISATTGDLGAQDLRDVASPSDTSLKPEVQNPQQHSPNEEEQHFSPSPSPLPEPPNHVASHDAFFSSSSPESLLNSSSLSQPSPTYDAHMSNAAGSSDSIELSSLASPFNNLQTAADRAMDQLSKQGNQNQHQHQQPTLGSHTNAAINILNSDSPQLIQSQPSVGMSEADFLIAQQQHQQYENLKQQQQASDALLMNSETFARYQQDQPEKSLSALQMLAAASSANQPTNQQQQQQLMMASLLAAASQQQLVNSNSFNPNAEQFQSSQSEREEAIKNLNILQSRQQQRNYFGYPSPFANSLYSNDQIRESQDASAASYNRLLATSGEHQQPLSGSATIIDEEAAAATAAAAGLPMIARQTASSSSMYPTISASQLYALQQQQQLLTTAPNGNLNLGYNSIPEVGSQNNMQVAASKQSNSRSGSSKRNSGGYGRKRQGSTNNKHISHHYHFNTLTPFEDAEGNPFSVMDEAQVSKHLKQKQHHHQQQQANQETDSNDEEQSSSGGDDEKRQARKSFLRRFSFKEIIKKFRHKQNKQPKDIDNDNNNNDQQQQQQQPQDSYQESANNEILQRQI